MLKRCGKCKLQKEEKEFSKEFKSIDKLQSRCKSCAKVHRDLYYLENKEGIIAHKKLYHEENRPEILLRMEKYRKDHPEYFKKWREENKEELAKYGRQWEREKIKTDINYKLRKAIRRRLHSAINNKQKAGSAVKDLGCSIPCLKFWLECQFYPNKETGDIMTWDNWSYEGWHIDHIRPLASFNLEEREQFLKACHFSNLQPLWAKENIIKRDILLKD